MEEATEPPPPTSTPTSTSTPVIEVVTEAEAETETQAVAVVVAAATRPCSKGNQCKRRDCVGRHPHGDLCPSFPQACANRSECASRHPVERSAKPASVAERKLCFKGDACVRVACKFFHPGGLLCRFHPRCKRSDGSVCTFRHPGAIKTPDDAAVVAASATAAAEAADKETTSDATHSPPPPPLPQAAATGGADAKPPLPPHNKKSSKPKPSIQDEIDRAIRDHDRITANEEEQLRATTAEASGRAVGGVNEQDEMTQLAMQAKLTELRGQREVFMAVVERLQHGESSEKARTNILKRELYRFRSRLPALAKRLQIEAYLSSGDSRFTVIQGQTGSGKSTQIPQYAADLPCFAGKRIICTQPRKLAATGLAARVAFEYSAGWDKAPVGGDVGCRVGGWFKTSSRTRIEYVTEAVVLDMIARARRGDADAMNPFEDVGCVIVDEAHERSITCDLIMGSLKESHAKWSHVKVVITSATIDLELFSGFFDNAPVVEIPGRMFPVDVQYVNAGGSQQSGVSETSKAATNVANWALKIHEEYPDRCEGDILCFLPGQEDLVRAKTVFEANLAKQLKMLPVGEHGLLQRVQCHLLYGKQTPEEQAAVLKKDTVNRKVIFATDVAETSVTIDGVVFVTDSGLRKNMLYDPLRNMSSLTVHTVSRSSALQRCGRAGRTRPGKCFRLYSQQDFDEMEIGNAAEIFQTPLTIALLTLSHVGIRPREFHWIEAPNDVAMARAEAELLYLGALDENGNITALGRLVAEVQIDPKLVRIIDRAAQQGLTQVGVDLVAVLSIENKAYHKGMKNDHVSKAEADKKRDQLMVSGQGDVVSLYRTYRAWKAMLEGVDGDSSMGSNALSPAPVVDADRSGVDDKRDEGEDAEGVYSTSMSANLSSSNPTETTHDPVDEHSMQSDLTGEEDDDDDAMSVISMGSEVSAVSEMSTASTRYNQKPRRNEKKARAWCLANSVNGKAMAMAAATAKEMLQTLSRARSWPHGKIDVRRTPSGDMSDDELRRLVVSGFFLNAAVLKPASTSTPYRTGAQYYALYSSVLGSLKRESAVSVDEKRGTSLPLWVLYDSIVRLTGKTLLSVVTPIDDAWIHEESPAFHDLCIQNRAELPVETLTYPNLSFAVLRILFGKSFQQVNRWEAQLKCTLSIDRESGTLSVFCAPVHVEQIKTTLDTRLATLLKRLAGDATEEVYMGTTRAVIGHGFQVEQLLFDQEFISITVRNLPDLSDRELELRLLQWTRAAGCSVDAIRSADILRGSSNSNATVSATIKFCTKETANLVYEAMRGDSSGGAAGQALSVTPIRKMGDQSNHAPAAAEFAGRIKLTWADGEATGDAKVYFRTAHDANKFVRNARSVLESTTTIAFAMGVNPEQAVAASGPTNLNAIGRGRPRKPTRAAASSGGPAPPSEAPTTKEQAGDGSAVWTVFDTGAIARMSLEQQSRLRYGVHIKGGLPPSMDEMELVDKIRPTAPGIVYAKIMRKPNAAAARTNTANERELETRYRRMGPLFTCLDDTCVHTDFIDQTTRRAGVVVFCRDLPRLRETYQLARVSDLWEELEEPHGQPIRMELEFSYAPELHADLHRCFRDQIARIITFARARGVVCEESQPTGFTTIASKNMVTIKFLGELPVLHRIKAKFDEYMDCEKIENPDLHVLFTVTGRRKVQLLMDKHMDKNHAKRRFFLRWINKKNSFWVYGDAPSRQYGITKLLRLVEELKSLEVVDQIVRLMDKKGAKQATIWQWLAKSADAKALYLYFAQSSRCLFLSGSTSQVAAVTEALARDGLVFQPRKKTWKHANANSGSKANCGLCTDTLEDPIITLAMCNHSFCLECIQRMVRIGTCSLPLKCPSGCGQTLHMDDASRIANDAEAMSILVEIAVFDYVGRHKSTVLECPKPGCSQILDAATILGADGGAVGGRSIFCDQCCADYCLDCSDTAGRPIKRHTKQTCSEFRARQGSPLVAIHLRTIQEQILNVACPHCHAVFLDFDGCTSVHCGNASCGHYFCANCLVFSSTSSDDTHGHVARCPSNPNTSHGGLKGYFVTDLQLAETHRAIRSQKLVAYFQDQLLDEGTRYSVYRRIAKDLVDLNVELPADLRGSQAAADAASFVSEEELESPGDATVRRHAQHVREHLLNLQCPSCGLVFVDFDFDSCAALTCANPQCKGGFCAYCLAACGDDAHAHVSKCTKNPNRPYYYVTEDEFHAVHRERREKLVAAYLRDVVMPNDGADMVRRVTVALDEDFRCLGLDADRMG